MGPRPVRDHKSMITFLRLICVGDTLIDKQITIDGRRNPEIWEDKREHCRGGVAKPGQTRRTQDENR